MKKPIFMPANILLPQTDKMTEWSVVACDQYTSEPEYWHSVIETTKDIPSTYHMVFPEIFLKADGFSSRIESINKTMQQYINDGIFKEYKNAYFYVERTLKNGTVRKGIIGMVDLESYEYEKGSTTPIRATEGTVLERIPPRAQIRKDALLELPHVMLLIDDRQKTVIEPLTSSKEDFSLVYDFELMQQSGSIKGYLLPEKYNEQLALSIAGLAEPQAFNNRYGTNDEAVLLFAVGDGNHSLATAKKCYQSLKDKIGDKALTHPARYALTELVNLHDSSLEFEAIHRVVFDVDPDRLLNALEQKYGFADEPCEGSQCLTAVIGGTEKKLCFKNPALSLCVGSLQVFIDEYLSSHSGDPLSGDPLSGDPLSGDPLSGDPHSGEVDYIHGEEVVRKLCLEHKNSIGFILPCMDKNDLFKTVVLDGSLPRKTFSMGEACDKRFYLEARRIAE